MKLIESIIVLINITRLRINPNPNPNPNPNYCAYLEDLTHEHKIFRETETSATIDKQVAMQGALNKVSIALIRVLGSLLLREASKRTK